MSRQKKLGRKLLGVFSKDAYFGRTGDNVSQLFPYNELFAGAVFKRIEGPTRPCFYTAGVRIHFLVRGLGIAVINNSAAIVGPGSYLIIPKQCSFYMIPKMVLDLKIFGYPDLSDKTKIPLIIDAPEVNFNQTFWRLFLGLALEQKVFGLSAPPSSIQSDIFSMSEKDLCNRLTTF